jgi:hypothetical protein
LDPGRKEYKMRRSIMLTAIIASLAFSAQANDGVELALKSKALAAASSSATMNISGTPSKQLQAPFTSVRDPLPELLMAEEQERRAVRGGCDYAAHDVCYDLADGRIVYRGARAFMPKIEGLKAESVSLRTNRISFKYSF